MIADPAGRATGDGHAHGSGFTGSYGVVMTIRFARKCDGINRSIVVCDQS